MTKRNKWIFGLIIILISLGAISVISIQTLCGDTIPDVVLDESITTFIDDVHQYTTHNLILTAEQYISNHVWFLAQAGSSIWTSATYQCDKEDCQLQRLYHEVGTKRYISCFRRMPGNEKVTQFRFDITRDHVEAETFSAEGGNMLSPWQLRETSPTIDEALKVVFDSIDPVFLERYPTIVVNLSAGVGQWQVSVQDLTANEQISIEIPFEPDTSSG